MDSQIFIEKNKTNDLATRQKRVEKKNWIFTPKIQDYIFQYIKYSLKHLRYDRDDR